VEEGMDKLFFNPGETRTIRIDRGPLKLDAIQTVAIYAIDNKSAVVASDSAKIKTIHYGEQIKILDQNQFTFALTNETVFVTVKNVGNVPTTLTRLWVNSSSQINLVNANVHYGRINRTIGPQETVIIKYNYTVVGKQYFNATDDAFLRVGTTAVDTSTVVPVKVNPMTAIQAQITGTATTGQGGVEVNFKNIGVAGTHINVTISRVKLEALGETRWIVPYNQNTTVAIGSTLAILQSLAPLPGSSTILAWTGTALSVGDKITVTIYSWEGGESTTFAYIAAT
jgi:hypothetical protein